MTTRGRKVFRVVGGLAIFALSVAIGVKWRLDAAKADQALMLSRLKPFVEVAAVPEPTGIPLLGVEGFDADGYPTQWVDMAGLRSLLKHRRFAALDTAFTHFQDAFEKNPRFERWPADATDEFGSAEPSLRPLLQDWVAHSPDSFAAWLALGSHLEAVAHGQRGAKVVRETSDTEFDEMRETLPVALDALEHALRLRPKLVAARAEELWVLVLMSDAFRFHETVKLADQSCPSCFLHRVVVMQSLRPRWGGTYEAMRAYAKSAPVAENPRLRFLKGYVELDRAEIAVHDDRLPDAMEEVEKACALGEHWAFLRERAHVERRGKAFDQARKDLDRALELRPANPDVLIERAELHLDLKDGESAGKDLLAALRVNPSHFRGEQVYGPTVQTLIHDAWVFRNAGRRDDALRVLDVAAELAPLDGEVIGRRVIVLTEGDAGIEGLRAQADATPDDFRSHQVLDYALAKENRYDEVVEMWTVFLSHHPDEGRAYSERAGAFHHLGKQRETIADLEKACELGVTEGCARLKR